jgi:hypothetical protein
MKPTQEELQSVYISSQLQAEERKAGAAMEVLRLVNIDKTVDGLIAAMNAAGYSDKETKSAIRTILWHNDKNKGSSHD